MSLLQLASMARMNSSVSQPLGELPANLLETFIPGYSTVARMVLESFSIDITTIVSITLLAFALGRSVAYLKEHILKMLMQHGTCSVEISSEGDAYLWIMDWVADRGIGVHYPHLVAVSSNRNASLYDSPPSFRSPHRRRSHKGKREQRYDPAPDSTQYFWYRGRLFRWHRRQDSHHYPEPRIEGRMSCVSWTTMPIKSLIDAAKTAYSQKRSQKTAIRRPAPLIQRRHASNAWKLVSLRPSRPLETVMLGSGQKDRIVSDIEEYLHPSSQEWYSERGIPYRRGYLMTGPPGTGKTSLSFAIAGHFNLDVHCISLAESSITEEDLVLLFDELPEKCLVLLEDVDCAGLVDRARLPLNNRALPARGISGNGSDNDVPRISLSGLLNVIDGIASHEGRVLIMTTNHVDSLDAALLRPGRVDLCIHFELATKKQAEDLFLRTFVEKSDQNSQGTTITAGDKGSLNQMALAFSAEIPEHVLSPAEIQGFLMNWKKQPAEAVARAREWVEESMKEKKDKAAAKLLDDKVIEADIPSL